MKLVVLFNEQIPKREHHKSLNNTDYGSEIVFSRSQYVGPLCSKDTGTFSCEILEDVGDRLVYYYDISFSGVGFHALSQLYVLVQICEATSRFGFTNMNR